MATGNQAAVAAGPANPTPAMEAPATPSPAAGAAAAAQQPLLWQRHPQPQLAHHPLSPLTAVEPLTPATLDEVQAPTIPGPQAVMPVTAVILATATPETQAATARAPGDTSGRGSGGGKVLTLKYSQRQPK